MFRSTLTSTASHLMAAAVIYEARRRPSPWDWGCQLLIPNTQKNATLEAALRCAERGWHVFPCHNQTKRPLTKHGLHDATRDADPIIEWFTRWPGAMIGVKCGKDSGILVLDLDVANGVDGVAEIKKLIADLPETIITKTPRGGLHLYFKYPDDGTEVRNSASKI